VRRDDLRIDPRFETLAKIVRIEGNETLSQTYPARWPARVTVVTGDGRQHMVDVPDVPGDSAMPLDWEDVTAKCAAAAGTRATALNPLKSACRALPGAGGTADLRAAVSATLDVVDFTQERVIK
jgi:2-methylcitrate dehydratase PrpD